MLAQKLYNNCFNIAPMSLQRDWMDKSSNKHAYKCFPVTLANTFGWSISCPEDLSFIYNSKSGSIDQPGDHIEILKGKNFAYSGGGQQFIRFNTNLIFKSELDTSLLTINCPNYFNDSFNVVSSILSTSFFNNPLPLAIKILKPDVIVEIKAGSPIATIIPISLKNLQDECIEIVDYDIPKNYFKEIEEYGIASQKMNRVGKWTNWYRNGVNHKGQKIGVHEVKSIKLKVIDNSRRK